MSLPQYTYGERAVLMSYADKQRLAFRCPGCEAQHVCSVNGVGTWEWNGSLDRLTLTPSVNVTYNGDDAGQVRDDGSKAPPAVCHSFVTNGRIRFLSDCTHALAGQTVDIPDWKSA